MLWLALTALAADPVVPAPIAVDPASTPIDVLFVGNSLSYGLPGMVQAISVALGGPNVRATGHLHPNFTLRRHLDDGHLPALLSQSEPWELVVLQEHSTLGVGYADATGTLGAPTTYHRNARELGSLVSKAGARPVVYATWPKKPFPAQAGPLREAFETAGKELDARIAPAGAAWEKALREHPEIELYAADGSHATEAGMYLNACVLYVAITGRSAVGAPPALSTTDPVGRPAVVSVPNDVADTLQRVADIALTPAP